MYYLSMDTTTEITSSERDEAAFRESVIKLRKEKGWSQNRLAKELQDAGLTEYRQATVARLENGERTLKLGESRIIANIFGTTVEKMISMPELSGYTNLLEKIGIRQTDADLTLRAVVKRQLAAREVTTQRANNPIPYEQLDPYASRNSELVKAYHAELKMIERLSRVRLLDIVADGVVDYLKSSGSVEFAAQILVELEQTDPVQLVEEIKTKWVKAEEAL